MAAQVLLLLLALLSNIQAEVLLIPGWSHRFSLDPAADFCSVSRWTNEGRELLRNSSDFYYELEPLDVSHSGQYQVHCWTRGNVTRESNSTLLVCDDQKMKGQRLNLRAGQTVEMTCDGMGPNQSVQWAYESYRTYELVLIDDGTPSEYEHRLVKNKQSLRLTVGKQSVTYFCLEKLQHRCDLRGRFAVRVAPEFILRLVGESLELNCSDGNQTHKWMMYDPLRAESQSLNSTLVFPSLTLEHSGVYTCKHLVSGEEHYHLFVCPESEPPAVVLFTEGENVTLHCGSTSHSGAVRWFMRSNGTEGRVSRVHEQQRPDNMFPSDSNLVIRNATLQDSGEFWCVVKKDALCVFRSETLVMLREPELDHRLVRSVLLSVVMLMMLSVVVVVGVMAWRGRRGDQLPEPVEELEMSQLSPESDVQEDTPV